MSTDARVPAMRWQAALGGSLLLHMGLTLVLMQTKLSGVPSPHPQRAPLITWLSDWRPPVTAMEQPQENRTETGEDAGGQEAVTEPETTPTRPAVELPTESPDTAEPSAPMFTDWEDEIERAIGRLREEEERSSSYVTFGFSPGAEEEPDWRYANSRDRPDRAPELNLQPEQNAFGELIVPLGDGCHMVARAGSILVEETFRFSDYYASPRSRCSRPARARSDLFADQKPDYLK